MPSTACPARGLARAGWFRLLGDTSTYITRYYHLSFKKCVEKKWSKYPVPRVIREHRGRHASPRMRCAQPWAHCYRRTGHSDHLFSTH